MTDRGREGGSDSGEAAGSAGAAELFAGPGEVRALARTLDWDATPLGAPAQWSPALRIAVGAMLDAPFPICLWSGPRFALVYNDAYRRILAAKHPHALGKPGSVVWAEIWADIAEQFEQVRSGGPSVAFENARFVMARLEGGRTEDAWFSYSLSPLRDEDGSFAAVLNISPETTGRVLAERAVDRARDRADRLQAMTSALAATTTPEEVADVVVAQGVASADAGTGMLAVKVEGIADEHTSEIVILRQTGLDAAIARAYARVAEDGPTPTARSVRNGESFFLTDADALGATFPAIAPVWDALHARALATVPLVVAGQAIGAMSFTFTTPREFTTEDREFFLALGHQAAQALERARLFTAERTARVRTEALQRVTSVLARAQSMADVGSVFSRELTRLLGAETAWVGTVTADGSAVEAQGWSGYDEATAQRWRRLPLDAGIALTDAVRSVSAQWWPTREALALTYPARAQMIRGMTQDAAAVLPILDELGAAIGGIVIGFNTPQRFDANTRGFFVALAQQCGQAIARARLYEAEQAARVEAEVARQAAEAANRAKSEFLAVMSHELRTPLNAIGGYTELIELGIHGPVTDAQRNALARVQSSQRHLLGLIAGVLDYSRVEAGAVAYRLADVPVAEAVAEAEVLVAPQLRAKGLGYVWSGAAPGLAVRADREKLQQILLNLLSNAVKFTSARDGVPGRIEVTCTDGGDEASRGLVLLHIRDTGHGIAEDKLEAVFEPFVQVDQRLTRPHEGTGLGLAISRDLARGMGGDLTVRSAPGVGSTFTLALPRA